MSRVWRGRAVRLLLGGAAGTAAKLTALWAGELPTFDLLGLSSLAFVTSAALFAWAGLAGVTALHLGWAAARGSTLAYTLVSGAVYLLAGAAVYVAFRRARGVGRGMPNLRSFLVYTLAAAAGAVLTGAVISLTFTGSWSVAAVWIRSTLVTVAVFGPPILILGDRLPRRWLAPVPDELPVQRRPAFAVEPRHPPGDLHALIRRPEPSRWRSFVVSLAMILTVAAATLATQSFLAASGFWLGLLYLVPILWGGRRHRLRGGLMVAAGAALAFLACEALFPLDRLGPELLRIHELASYAYVVMFVVVGVLVGEAWEREADLLEHLAESNRMLRADLQRVARALSSAVEAKDLYTEGHLQRVSDFAVAVGRRLGLSDRELELLQMASALHDVGKIGVPEQILNKPGPLDEAERVIVQRHPEIGARILETVEGLEHAAPLVLHHQERWDGRRDAEFPGYPAGLSGEAIPLGARIISVVDAFDAMTTDRSYRRAMSSDNAAEVLRSEVGRQFDPGVVEVFLSLLEERSWE